MSYFKNNWSTLHLQVFFESWENDYIATGQGYFQGLKDCPIIGTNANFRKLEQRLLCLLRSHYRYEVTPFHGDRVANTVLMTVRKFIRTGDIALKRCCLVTGAILLLRSATAPLTGVNFTHSMELYTPYAKTLFIHSFNVPISRKELNLTLFIYVFKKELSTI